MKVLDLTKQYKNFCLTKKNFEAYFSTYPALFEHYFEFWANKKEFTPILNPIETDDRMNILLSTLLQVEKKIEKYLSLSLKKQKIIFFVGLNKTNGHAFQDKDGHFVVWIPIESYISKLRAKVFLTHEIIHALHYSKAPELYFHDKEEMKMVAKCLIVEGLATYLTIKILNINQKEALFADYITNEEADKLMADFDNKEKDLNKYVLANLNSSDKKDLFNATDVNDIFKYKGGYLIGMKVIKKICNKYQIDNQKILNLSYDELLKMVKTTI